MTGIVWETAPVEVPRDFRKRPLIKPLDGGTKLTPYTRCTNFIGVLEDTTQLSKWSQRNVALGMTLRPDLYDEAQRLGHQPDDDVLAKPWKSAMNTICWKAGVEGRGEDAAQIGTDLHEWTEALDRGDSFNCPDRFVPHIQAYEKATASFTPVHIERFTVHDDLKIGGTPDRVLRIPGHDKLIIGDLKTGRVDYPAKMAMQLAVYSRSLLYDPATGERSPQGDIDQERGVIIHLDAKTAVCSLLWIELDWDGVLLANEVRRWRAQPSRTTPYAGPVDDLTVAADLSLESRISAADTVDELTMLWSTYRGTVWDDRHTALAAARKRQLALHSVT